jgi:hypothetical protein
MKLEMKILRTSLSLFFTCSTAMAEPAVFSAGEMIIPEGAVINQTSAAYFSDITLAYDGENGFIITGAKANPLVQVEAIDILIMESFPLQISAAVNGFLSVPCVELLSPAVSFTDNTFTVVLAESTLGPAESCIAVIEPFETIVSLDVLDLPAGTYRVDVNGVTAEFIFEIDNSPLN